MLQATPRADLEEIVPPHQTGPGGDKEKPLLEVRDLRVDFPARTSFLSRNPTVVRAVRGVTLRVAPGETLGLVGESGSGKTTIGRAMVRLLDPTEGSVRFDGEDITRLTGARLKQVRRRIQMVFQDPYGSLNPRMTAAQILAEPLEVHNVATGPGERDQRVLEALAAVGLEASAGWRYPHQFSGGQRQRIGIARALALDPQLLVCDEPVSALDVSVQAQIVNLLVSLRETRNLAMIFIAHDLAVVSHISHRVAVLYLGQVVELADSDRITSDPLHPYTQALLSAVPAPTVDRSVRRRITIVGEPPSPLAPPAGCSFHPRCPLATSRCRTEAPILRKVRANHWAACHEVLEAR